MQRDRGMTLLDLCTHRASCRVVHGACGAHELKDDAVTHRLSSFRETAALAERRQQLFVDQGASL